MQSSSDQLPLILKFIFQFKSNYEFGKSHNLTNSVSVRAKLKRTSSQSFNYYTWVRCISSYFSVIGNVTQLKGNKFAAVLRHR